MREVRSSVPLDRAIRRNGERLAARLDHVMAEVDRLRMRVRYEMAREVDLGRIARGVLRAVSAFAARTDLAGLADSAAEHDVLAAIRDTLRTIKAPPKSNETAQAGNG